ncbi:MAG TPA: hypothetical protein VFC73_06575 [Syntrophomonadaceae bacterium]|nr:hypothetical protein [Syntrophomonadaceae bacterium]
MITYKERRQIEKKQEIAKTYCRMCREPIGDKPYMMFEERYFHAYCLRKERT